MEQTGRRRIQEAGIVLFLTALLGFSLSAASSERNDEIGACIRANKTPAQNEARFAGMVCVPLTNVQLREVAEVYGEECGVFVSKVMPNSWAEASGVLADDILISVRMPDEEEFYPIPPDFVDMVQFAKETEPAAGIRLLILRKKNESLERVELPLGPSGKVPPTREKPTTSPAKTEEESGLSSKNFQFASTHPENILTRALDGSPLTQHDVDIFGGVMAWAFGTRLTEAQKKIVHSALLEFWPQTPQDVVQMFRIGILSTPSLFPKLPPEKREELRIGYANTFLQMAQGMGDHPLASVIMTISASARNVLAGAGTDAELTLQDAHALLEYLAFSAQIQTGQPVMIMPSQRDEFVTQVKAYFEKASRAEKIVLAEMDERWAVLRARWVSAAAARQQALIRQWQQAYAHQQAQGWYSPFQSGRQGAGSGGGMSDSQFNAVMSSLNTLHESSQQTLGSIDGGYDSSVYDSAGQWLYDY